MAFDVIEVGQRHKIETINGNFAKTPSYMSELATDPTELDDVAPGTTYFNTGTNKLKVLKSDKTWVNVA